MSTPSKIKLKNIAACPLLGKAPGEEFSVDAADGQPAALYWRKRLADRSVSVLLDEPAAAPVKSTASPKLALKKE